MSDYSQWPCREFERPFYKERPIGPYSYLVPCAKLGQGKIDTAAAVRQGEALRILAGSPVALSKIRKEQADALASSLEAVKLLLAGAEKEEAKQRFAEILVSLTAQTLLPESGEATDEDAAYYVRTHQRERDLHCAWTSALYIPFPGSPSIKDIYDHIPVHVLLETQDFFVESASAPDKKLNATPASSTEGNG